MLLWKVHGGCTCSSGPFESKAQIELCERQLVTGAFIAGSASGPSVYSAALRTRGKSFFKSPFCIWCIYIYTYMYGFNFIDRIWMTWSSVSGCEWQHREQARQDSVQRTLYLPFKTPLILMPWDVRPRTAATTWGHDWTPISEQHLLCVGPNKFEAGAHHPPMVS